MVIPSNKTYQIDRSLEYHLIENIYQSDKNTHWVAI